jgi:hypothetical protein
MVVHVRPWLAEKLGFLTGIVSVGSIHLKSI